jgi:hypothetical protein
MNGKYRSFFYFCSLVTSFNQLKAHVLWAEVIKKPRKEKLLRVLLAKADQPGPPRKPPLRKMANS